MGLKYKKEQQLIKVFHDFFYILAGILVLLSISCQTVPVSPDVPMPTDVPVSPDVPVTIDVPVSPEIPVPIDMPVPPDVPAPSPSPPPPPENEPALTLEEFCRNRKVFAELSEFQKSSLIETTIESMEVEEKIGQLLMLDLRRTSEGKPILGMDDSVRSFMDFYRPGGIILFQINFDSPEQTKEFIGELQNNSQIPLFISTDEEGGAVSRLGKAPGMNVVSLPTAREIGDKEDSLLAEKRASELALEMKELGFNMNMAPVADVRRRGPNDIIGSRSFSSDPVIAALMTASMVRGFEDNGISAVLKHFPGHGNVTGDSHNGSVISLSSLEEFREVDFVPFRKGIAAGADFIMVAHISAPALTGSTTPASISSQIQTQVLRGELGFKGLIISDSMDMKAVSMKYPPGEAALKAFLAGTDIILMPHNILSAQKTLVEAVKTGIISPQRLEQSLRRILKLKFEKGLFDDYLREGSNMR